MITTALASLVLLGQSVSPSCKIALSLMPKSPVSEEGYISAVREQVRLGVQGAYASVKWSELQGPQNMKPLADQFGIAKFVGGDLVVCIKLVDTSNRTLPDSLQNFAFDDPAVSERLEETLLEIVKILPKNVKAISLGNEVDVYFSEHPKELPAFLNLVRSAKTLLRGAGVKIPMGVITTYDGALRKPEMVKQIQSGFDVAMMTYYPIDSAFQVTSIQDVGKHFDTMLKVAGSKPLFITEIGCPASERNGSSEETQAKFVAEAFKQLRIHDKEIPLANFFLQTDFSDQVLDFLEVYYRLKDERFRAYLGSLGLTKADGTRKKSFTEFKRQMQAWNMD
jgi:hypothetical protein